MLLKQQCYIDGQWLGTGEIAVSNPATGEIIAHVPNFGAAEAEQAVAAAAAALPAWRDKTAKERSKILRKWFDLIMQHQDELAEILTREQGKPLTEARGEIAYGASYIEWYAEEAKRIYGETIPAAGENQKIIVQKQAVGVCAAITPQCQDYPQSRARFGGRLQLYHSSRQSNAAFCVGIGGIGRRGGHSQRRV